MTEVTTTKSDLTLTCWALVSDDSFESCGAPAQVWATSNFFTWPLCEHHLRELQADCHHVKVEPLGDTEN